MKKTTYITGLLVFMIAFSSCNDDFMNRFPETEIGKDNFFNSEEDLAIYIYNLYDFPGTGNYERDGYSTTDNASNTGNTELKTMMVGNPSSSTITGGWNWEKLRTINFFLDNFRKADIPEGSLNHYEGLARFFRARFYMNKVKRFSDVPWYDKALETDDEEELFKPRDSREMVVDRIFEDFQFAADHVLVEQPAGAVNRWVVKSYMARHALHEGTYRKYHDELNLQSTADKYLEMARDLAKDIINNGGFSIYTTGDPSSDYGSLFNSADLTDNPEIILPRIHDYNVNNSGWWEGIFGNYEVSPSKDLLQAYLMDDGSFYTDQDNYETKLFVDEFENRDPRLYQTYAYPGFELINTRTYAQGGGIYIQQLQKNFSGYHQLKGFINVKDDEFISSVDFPVVRYAEILLIYAEARAELGELTQGDLDMTVNVLRDRAGMPHMTMNPEVDPVQEARYQNVKSNNQWKEILEIRRERRIEFALEGYRFDDLMRWKAGKLVEKEPEGLYFPGLGKYDLTGDGVEDIILIDVSESVPLPENKETNSLGETLIYHRVGMQDSDAAVYLKNGDSGTIQTVRERGTFVEPKYYYRPVPETHVTVNPKLTQIFGWQ
jgi:hypothetical protein